jgi:hypothetical protein
MISFDTCSKTGSALLWLLGIFWGWILLLMRLHHFYCIELVDIVSYFSKRLLFITFITTWYKYISGWSTIVVPIVKDASLETIRFSMLTSFLNWQITLLFVLRATGYDLLGWFLGRKFNSSQSLCRRTNLIDWDVTFLLIFDWLNTESFFICWFTTWWNWTSISLLGSWDARDSYTRLIGYSVIESIASCVSARLFLLFLEQKRI